MSPAVVLLSGGLDSSLVAACAARTCCSAGKPANGTCTGGRVAQPASRTQDTIATLASQIYRDPNELTRTMLMPAMALSSSAARCDVVPMPADANASSWPSGAVARAVSA